VFRETGQREAVRRMILRSTVEQDEYTEKVAQTFDYTFDGTTEFRVPEVELPREGLGLIVGPSGSGKTSLLRGVGELDAVEWPQGKAIVSAFDSPDDAVNRLMAVGLNSVPSWLRPYDVLSTGEQFRADLARRLRDGALVDEFTSVVDRTVARATSVALSRYVRAQGWGVTLASCHRDIVDWLEPDWLYDTLDGSLVVGRRQRRPSIEVELYEGREARALWPVFRQHHYLTDTLLKNARCWVALWDDTLIGFASSIAMPNGAVKNAWREHRTVILPDYQGLGLGVRLSDRIGAIHKGEGKRYFSRTAHPRMGEYRNRSSLWRPTSKNRVRRADYTTEAGEKRQGAYNAYYVNTARVAYSHEYIGPPYMRL
jgi:ABC-type ATPase involved in cell division/GNAT superfamily N-acetyltransferase